MSLTLEKIAETIKNTGSKLCVCGHDFHDFHQDVGGGLFPCFADGCECESYDSGTDTRAHPLMPWLYE